MLEETKQAETSSDDEYTTPVTIASVNASSDDGTNGVLLNWVTNWSQFTSVALMLAVLGTFQQATAILALRNVKRKHRPMYKFVFNMTISELFLQISNTLLCIRVKMLYPSQIDASTFLLTQISRMFASAAVHSILCMVVDQYIAICHPLEYILIITDGCVRVMLTSYWIVSFGLMSQSMIVFFVYEESNIALVNALHMAYILVVFLAMLFLYYKIIWTVRDVMQRAPPLAHGSAVKGQLGTAITVLFLLVFWMPYWIVPVIENSISVEKNTRAKAVLFRLHLVLHILGPMADPVIYGLRMKEVRHAYRRVFFCFECNWFRQFN